MTLLLPSQSAFVTMVIYIWKIPCSFDKWLLSCDEVRGLIGSLNTEITVGSFDCWSNKKVEKYLKLFL